MKRVLFHGTTREAYESIKTRGFGTNREYGNWTCSNLSATYFYDISRAEFDEHEEQQDKEQYAIERAFESAKLAAAVSDYAGLEVVVLRVEIDEEYVNEDWSCENMDDLASEVYNSDLNKHGKITNVYKSDYAPSLKLFILNGVYGKQYFEDTGLLDYERRILESGALKDVFIEEIYNSEYEEIHV